MGARAVIELTSGIPGSGKSYRRCAWFLVNEWLPNHSGPTAAQPNNGVHWSNFPIFREKIAAEVSRRTGRPAEEFSKRLQVFPKEVLELWRSGESGPWDFFAGKSIDGAHIAVDEIHVYCGKSKKGKSSRGESVVGRWQAWIGEIRHQGATVEFLTQSVKKMAPELYAECGLRRVLTNTELRRDPLFFIPMGDWYEIQGGLFAGEYRAKVFEVEHREVGEKWVKEHVDSFALDPSYFQFYDSYSAPNAGGVAGAALGEHEFQRRTKRGLLWWFYKRHWFTLTWRMAAAWLVVWICAGGGGFLVKGGMRYLTQMVQSTAKRNNALPTPTPSTVVSLPTGVAGAASRPSWLKVRSSSQPASRPVDLSGPALAYVEELERQQVEQAKKLRDVEERLGRVTAVVLLGPDAVGLRGGMVYRVGEQIDVGEFSGRRVTSIDLRRRVVRLDNGQTIRLSD